MPESEAPEVPGDPLDPDPMLEDRGLMARDPVCGKAVDTVDPPGSTEYEGVPYYFCSQLCRQAFLADPTRYAG